MHQKILCTLTLLSAMPVFSASVKITVTAKDTGFVYPPYYVVYLANERGKFVKTLYIMGQNYTYQRNMRWWFGNAIRNTEDIDALSGASLKSGKALTRNVFIDNDYIKDGYQIVIESASRQNGNIRREVVIPLTADKKQRTAYGTHHTESVTVTIK